MQNEEITQSHILTPGVEQSFGTLSRPHELSQIVVNANGAGEANHSSWKLYDTAGAGAALIWEGVLSPPFAVAQRLTPKEGVGAGGLVELRATLDPNAIGPTSVAVTASLIGYDPSCCGDSGTGTGADSEDDVLTWGRGEIEEGTAWLTPGYDASNASQPNEIPSGMPRDGVFRHLFVSQSGPGDGEGTVAYTLFVNGVETALVATLDVTDTTGTDFVNEVDVLEGDLISWRTLASGEEIEELPTGVVLTVLFGKAV